MNRPAALTGFAKMKSNESADWSAMLVKIDEEIALRPELMFAAVTKFAPKGVAMFWTTFTPRPAVWTMLRPMPATLALIAARQLLQAPSESNVATDNAPVLAANVD